MQKVLKQNLHKIVIYVNKPRPAAKDYSQSTAKDAQICLTSSSSQSARYVYVSTNWVSAQKWGRKKYFALKNYSSIPTTLWILIMFVTISSTAKESGNCWIILLCYCREGHKKGGNNSPGAEEFQQQCRRYFLIFNSTPFCFWKIIGLSMGAPIFILSRVPSNLVAPLSVGLTACGVFWHRLQCTQTTDSVL